MHTPTHAIDIDVLRTLVNFAATPEVATTAQTLGLSASVVSRRLTGLQGPPWELIAKRGNTVVLTAKGETLLPEMKRVVRDYDQLAARLGNRDTATRTLHLAVGSGVAHTRLPVAVAAFQKQQPGVRLRCSSVRGRERIRGVVLGIYDMALVAHSEAQIRTLAGEGVELAMLNLGDYALVVAAAATSPDGRTLAALPATQPVPAILLVQLNLLGLEEKSGLRRQLDAEFRQAGVTPPSHYALYPGGWDALRAFAQHGLGTALLPAAVLTPPDPTLVVRPALPSYTITDRLIWQPNADELTMAFVKCLQAAWA